MTGVIRAVNHWRERAAAIRLYLLKFPFVEQFVRQQFSEGRLSTPKAAGLDLFVFEADHMLYLDNQRGFGTRLEVDPEE